MLRALMMTMMLASVGHAQESDQQHAQDLRTKTTAIFEEAVRVRDSSSFQQGLQQQRQAIENVQVPNIDIDQNHSNNAAKAMRSAQELMRSKDFKKDLEQGKQALDHAPKAGQLYDFSKMPRLASSKPEPGVLATGKQRPDVDTPFTDGPLIFVSFSMPDSLIVDYLEQAQRVQGQVIIRGAIDGDLPATIIRIQKLITEHQTQGLMIDPTLFTRFKVEHVPTLVMPLETLKPCQANDCPTPQHAKASGDISIVSFLKTVARLGDQDEQKAAQALLIKAQVSR